MGKFRARRPVLGCHFGRGVVILCASCHLLLKLSAASTGLHQRLIPRSIIEPTYRLR